MKLTQEIVPVITVRLAKEQVFFGPGVAMIMQEVKKTGSIKEACRKSGLSYTKAWKIINTAEAELGYPIITRQHGGKSGGGCVITEQGKTILEKYEQAETAIKEYAQKLFENTLAF